MPVLRHIYHARGAAQSGDVDAKAQLMDALTDAIKAEKMDKATMESIYNHFRSFFVFRNLQTAR